MRLKSLTIFSLLALTFSLAAADEVVYKKYERPQRAITIYLIDVADGEVAFEIPEGENPPGISGDLKKLAVTPGGVYLGKELVFRDSFLPIGKDTIAVSEIDDALVFGEDGLFTLEFKHETERTGRTERFKRGNLFGGKDNTTVAQDQFIRGFVLTSSGNIEVYGEVNKDVISFTGDIYVAPGAVVRGDIVTLTGRVELAREATVYGEVFTGRGEYDRDRYRQSKLRDRFEPLTEITYDRVDGLGLYAGVRYEDTYSALPRMQAQVGYAFNSERIRFNFDADKIIWRDPEITVGLSIYRKQGTDDEYLMPRWENTVMALFAREDFRDYYEADGGAVFASIKPFEYTTFSIAYRHDETEYFMAQPNLWSFFGGDKKFRDNFSTVPYGIRGLGAFEIDKTTEAHIRLSAEYDQHDVNDPFGYSSWHFDGWLEISHPDLDSDFDYNRYRLTARRYQSLHRRSMLIMRATLGNSDGYLPMHRRFYVGGLGTLHGYDHKEFMGTRFWMTNIEFRYDLAWAEAAFGLFYDAAQTAYDTKLDGDIDIKQDIGIAAYLDEDFRISLARRLDRSYDNDLKFYLRLSHQF